MFESAAKLPIGDLMDHKRTYVILINNGFWTIDDLLQVCEEDFFHISRGFGGLDLEHVKQVVAEAGFRLPAESAPWVRASLSKRREILFERNGGDARQLHASRYSDKYRKTPLTEHKRDADEPECPR